VSVVIYARGNLMLPLGFALGATSNCRGQIYSKCLADLTGCNLFCHPSSIIGAFIIIIIYYMCVYYIILHTFYLDAISKFSISEFIKTILILIFIAVARKWQSVNRYPSKYTRLPYNIVERLLVNNLCQQSLSAIFTLELNQSPNSY